MKPSRLLENGKDHNLGLVLHFEIGFSLVVDSVANIVKVSVCSIILDIILFVWRMVLDELE